MLACMTLVSQLYLSSQSLAKLASLSSTLLEIGAFSARLARGSQASVVAPRTPLLSIHKTFLCKIHYYDTVIDSWLSNMCVRACGRGRREYLKKLIIYV
ncbi:uncharacterized protein K441DRAFT_371126 [Cenococcum geophilum 1.58]|uniref:uncharacterized protein n=1 Tax=Cenococcum geophilum 1.58 TaxID=794803 RepID=UPI00358E6C2F|nr:hypothetical protein K441DRAFT_371126 [Cenococcum geophilum 1.58]